MTQKTRECANPFCAKVKPATTDYFYKQRYGKDGLDATCKECRKQTYARRTESKKIRLTRPYQ